MMLPTAMAHELGAQHRNDMLAASARWRNYRLARLARLASLRRQSEALTAPPATRPCTAKSAAATAADVAPTPSAIDVRRPLVRS